ncbi:MAG: hypothetical protein K0B81_09155 [Candidatus Cloacimonetes bacterium]|nr:hypothetical protein [Candidatus Cloacimonadota bacterium]
MGRHAIIMIVALVILLSYFVIHTNNAKIAASSQNYDDYSYKQAKNISNSAAQMIARNIMRPDISGWPDFRKNIYSGLLNEHVSDYTDWSEWNSLGGEYKVESLTKSGSDLILIVTGRESFGSKEQQTRLILKENETTYNIFSYALYSLSDIAIGENPIIDSYHSNYGYDKTLGPGGNGEKALVATELPYQHETYPINGTANIYGPDPIYEADEYIPEIELPEGGTPISIHKTQDSTITEGVYRVDGALELLGSTVLTIDGDVTLYLPQIKHPGNIVLNIGGTASIVIKEGASLTIYADGNLEVGGTGIVNLSEIPSNLEIYGTENCQTVKLHGTSDIHGVIFTPDASASIRGSGTLFGSITCNSMVQWGSGTVAIHYDEALGIDPTFEWASIFTYYISSWQ